MEAAMRRYAELGFTRSKRDMQGGFKAVTSIIRSMECSTISGS